MSGERHAGRLLTAREFAALTHAEQWEHADAALADALDELVSAGIDPSQHEDRTERLLNRWKMYWLRVAVSALALDRPLECVEYVAMARWPQLRQGLMRSLSPPRVSMATLRLAHQWARRRRAKPES
jgi:hypothetical protein